jgi:hypothetical protein
MENALTPENQPFGQERVKAKRHTTSFLDLWKMYLYRLYHTKFLYILSGILFLVAVIVVIFMAEGNAQILKNYIEARGSSDGFTPSFSLSQAALWCFSVPTGSLDVGSSSIFSVNVNVGFVVLILIVFYVGKDWQNRTFRNQILAGHGRWEIYLAAQLTSLLVALGLVSLWESVIWGLGSALQVPAFIPGQFDIRIDASTTIAYDVTKVFTISFFMELLLFLSFTVITCAWCFIIPNSWGSLGLLYGTFFVITMLGYILSGVEAFNNQSYYFVQEFLFPYQVTRFSSFSPDIYTTYEFIENEGWNVITHTGRTGILCLVTGFTSLFWIGGMGYLGGLAFQKKDLK